MTYDHRTGEVIVYIDGAPQVTANVGTEPLLTNLPLYIGYDPVENRAFNGQLDEVTLYRRVLTPAEVGGIAAATVWQVPAAGTKCRPTGGCRLRPDFRAVGRSRCAERLDE